MLFWNNDSQDFCGPYSISISLLISSLSTIILWVWPWAPCNFWVFYIKCLKCLEYPTARLLKCSLSARMPKCLSAKVFKCLKCPSVQVSFESPSSLSAWLPECPSALNAQVSKCPSGALMAQLPLECPWSDLKVPLEWSLSALRVKRFCNIKRNGLVNSFMDFLKTFQNTYLT